MTITNTSMTSSSGTGASGTGTSGTGTSGTGASGSGTGTSSTGTGTTGTAGTGTTASSQSITMSFVITEPTASIMPGVANVNELLLFPGLELSFSDSMGSGLGYATAQ